jgi:hypothetical protein
VCSPSAGVQSIESEAWLVFAPFVIGLDHVQVLPSADAALALLAMNAGALSPGFDADVLEYEMDVGEKQAVITLSLTTRDLFASWNVTRARDPSVVWQRQNAPEATEMISVDVSPGVNELTIHVTSEDQSSHRKYMLRLKRAMTIKCSNSVLKCHEGGGGNVSVACDRLSCSMVNPIPNHTVVPLPRMRRDIRRMLRDAKLFELMTPTHLHAESALAKVQATRLPLLISVATLCIPPWQAGARSVGLIASFRVVNDSIAFEVEFASLGPLLIQVRAARAQAASPCSALPFRSVADPVPA